MKISSHMTKNFLFEFILKEYHNKVKYGHEPTPIDFFYNNWLIDKLLEEGLIPSYNPPDMIKEEYQDKLIEVTWDSLECLQKDGLIKRRLKNSEDIGRWDLYIPTEKGLYLWEKFGRLLLTPSNYIEVLRADLPDINPDSENMLAYLSEAISCIQNNLYLGCIICLNQAVEISLLSLKKAITGYLNDGEWEKSAHKAKNSFDILALIKEKINEFIKSERLVKEYNLLYPRPVPDFQEDIEALARGLELVSGIISITHNKDFTPSVQVVKIEDSLKEELIRGYLLGSYLFFKQTFKIKEILENMSNYKKSAKNQKMNVTKL